MVRVTYVRHISLPFADFLVLHLSDDDDVFVLSLMLFIASKHRLGLFSCGLESRTDGAPSEQILVEVARENHRGLIKDGPDSVDAYDVTSSCFGKDFTNIFTVAGLQNYQVNH